MPEIGPLREQQQFARPTRLELFTRDDERTAFAWVLNQGLLAVDFGEYDIPVLAQLGDCGKRRSLKLVPPAFQYTGLQSQMFGRTQQLYIREGFP
jgi:hypothetical protein